MRARAREGQLLDRLKNPDLRFAWYRRQFGPAGGDIGQIQRLGVVASSSTPLVSHQLHFNEDRSPLVPIHKRADCYLMP